MKDSMIIEILNAMISKEGVCIGEIDFGDEFFTEDTLGKVNFGSRVGLASIEVRPLEGDNIPHFHIVSKPSQINIAVRIDIADYFVHPHAPNVFYNTKQTKALDKFLRKVYDKEEDPNATYYDIMVETFNMMHPKNTIENNGQPDYTTLETNKKGRLK